MPVEVEGYQPERWRKIANFFWDTWDMPPVQRHYVRKIDFFIFSYSLLSYIVKSLDQNNFSNAYVSGMKDDLKLFGQERNLFTTLFNMGYLSGSVPNQFIINRVRPSLYLPFCELVWGVLTTVIAAAHSARVIYGIRFVCGFFESALFPSFNVILGSWYAPPELGKRMALFEVSYAIAGMFSGYLMSGLYSTMNGTGGLAAWRWMFIFDGVITIPIAFLGMLMIPDFPHTTRVPWLSKWEKEYGIRRAAELGRVKQKPLTAAAIKEIFLKPTVYYATWPYTANFFASYTGYFNLWLSSLKDLSVQQVNLIPTAGSALSLISCGIMPVISDKYRIRWQFGALSSGFCLLGAILLSVWYLPEGVLMFANLVPNLGAPGQPIIIAWMSESFQDNTELRSMIIGFGNVIDYAFQAWIPLVVYQTNQAPHYKYGYQISAMIYALHIISIVMFSFHVKSYHRKRGMIMNEFGLPVPLEELGSEGSIVIRDGSSIENIEKGLDSKSLPKENVAVKVATLDG
ncbi:major facilitator superfamily domain-containing protein [Dipodascopsis tothii]|uniref:major facilitator superfamily domain-containing protein n=1 Tax=Dipodascopsis tothii TaxID=44089 RepID=UPI0034CD8161